MSFLGCIGNVMSASGLEELLGVVYAQNTVGHMMSGKALARAVRGHFLVDAALGAIVTAEAFHVALPGPFENHDVLENYLESDSIETQPDIPEVLQKATQLYNKLAAGDVDSNAVCSEHLLDEIREKLEKQKTVMATHPTARLWVQYMEMISLLRQFIKQRERETGLYIYRHYIKCFHILLLRNITYTLNPSIFTSSK
ncbi:hypothetical protein SNE40_009744 [Patella caerulea]|uniref:Uncharacterized protein n=1 Tax=Patella caerulea TaxID=87958 RepID=A0AAN8JZ87_PATCE